MARLIDEEEAFKVLSAYYKHSTQVQDSALHDALSRVPSADLVNEWCTDCKEYDKAQHCCHRLTKVIRQTMEELKQNAVPVIRCKDCKHYYVLNEFRGNCSEYNFVEKIPIDYCSWAERKEE